MSYFVLLLDDEDCVNICGLNIIPDESKDKIRVITSPHKIISTNNIQFVTANDRQAVFIKNDCTVYSYGYNNYGQLGLGYFNFFTQSPLMIPDFKAVYANCGDHHTVFIDEEGDVFTCGHNETGLGYMSDEWVVSPTKIPGFKAKRAFCGVNHTVFLAENGEVYTCGINNHGQLGYASPKTYIPTQIQNIVAVEASCSRFCTSILDENGDVYVCGYLTLVDNEEHVEQICSWELSKVSRNIKVAHIEHGPGYLIFITEDNSVYALGDNSLYKLGVDADTEEVVYEPTLVEDIKAVSAICNEYSVYLIGKKGEVYSCGSNYCGELGLGCTSHHIKEFAQIPGFKHKTLARKQSKSARNR